eukprot:scaffold108179_cov66-Phaeocystis_antarctica.AAC.2
MRRTLFASCRTLHIHCTLASATRSLYLAAARARQTGELGCCGTSPPNRSRTQRRSPIIVRGCLRELRHRARPRLPNATLPAQHERPHAIGAHIVRRRRHNPRRQRLEPLVVPPFRLGHLVAYLLRQIIEGPCRGPCPVLQAHRTALLGLEVPLRSLHGVPRVVERCTEVVVRLGPVGPQGDGLAESPGCSAPVLFDGVPQAVSHQLQVLVARLRGVPGQLLRGLAMPLLHRPTILRHLPTHLQPLAPGFPGQLTQHQYVVGTLYLRHFGQTGCFSRSSPISDGILAQPKQARLGASDASGGATLSSAAGGAAATSVPSPSAFSAVSASRTSLVPAPRSGCRCRSLASSGLGPRSGSASHSPRTASSRASVIGACLLQHLRAPQYATAPGKKRESASKPVRGEPNLRAKRVYYCTGWFTECISHDGHVATNVSMSARAAGPGRWVQTIIETETHRSSVPPT